MFVFPVPALRNNLKCVARTTLGTAAAAVIAIATIAALATLPSGKAVAAPNKKYAAIVVDVHTGKAIFSRHADAYRYPASLTKIMTLYLVFEELDAGRLTKKSMLKVSKRAAAQPPSKLGLRPGQKISVENAIKALVTKSANDVAVVIAENLAGTERKFAKRMTKTARRLGMKRTQFKNASGLPNRKQRTTARDMARLGIRVQKDFPKHYGYFKIKAFKYKGRTYKSHNRLLGRVRGTDGIKTGYTRASGFNLTSSVRRGGRHVVAVVMGGKTGRSRDRHMEALLKKHIPKASKRLKKKRQPATASPKSTGKTVARLTAGKPSAPKNVTTIAKTHPAKETKDRVSAKSASGTDRIAAIASSNKASLSEEGSSSEDASVTQDRARPQTVGDIIASVAAADEPVGAGDVDDDADTDQVSATEEDSESTGIDSNATWSIQIGAYASEEDALLLLKRAQKAGIAALRDKKAIALVYNSADQVLYRARFSGFDKASAQQACTELSEKSINCYPLAP